MAVLLRHWWDFGAYEKPIEALKSIRLVQVQAEACVGLGRGAVLSSGLVVWQPKLQQRMPRAFSG